MSRRRIHPNQIRIDFARATGFSEYPNNATAEPYLNYISNRHIGRGTLDEYLRLFVRVIAHCENDKVDQDVSPKPNSILELLNTLVASESEELFVDTKAGSRIRRDDVEDTVLYILGSWTMMLSSFVQLPNGFRKVTTAYSIQAQSQGVETSPYEDCLAGLIKGSDLLPKPGSQGNTADVDPENDIVKTAMKLVSLLSDAQGMPSTTDARLENSLSPSLLGGMDSKMARCCVSHQSLDDMDSLESLSIKGTRLNAFRLNVLGAVDISWTHNISRHMLLSRRGGRHVLELFALPCAFNASTITSEAVGISSELAQEIQESYSILFNAWPDTPLHVKLGFVAIRRFCWCWSCSAHRHRSRVISKYKKSFATKSRKVKRNQKRAQESEYDPLLVELMTHDGSCDWTYDLFPCLWQRITILDEHLQAAKPWSIWILFRDRRDTLQFWTFFFATLVVFLTFLQVALGIAQVAGSFQ